jgi:hypothetical protein
MPTEERISVLFERLDADGGRAEAMQIDTFATLREMGFEDLEPTVQQERDRIAALLDRIYLDDAFRSAVEQDPIGELGSFGIPEIAIEPVLVLAGAPDDVIERATADVEAHLLGGKRTVVAMAAVLGAMAFAQQSTAAQPAASLQVSPQVTAQVSAQVTPQVSAQVTPQVSAQVTPQVSAHVEPAAKAQISKAQIRWQGVQPERLRAQGFGLLRAQNLLK